MEKTVTREEVEVTIRPTQAELQSGSAHDESVYVETSVMNEADDGEAVTVEFSMDCPEELTVLAVNDESAPMMDEVEMLDYTAEVDSSGYWSGDFSVSYDGTEDKTIEATLYVTIDGHTKFVDLVFDCRGSDGGTSEFFE